MTLGSLFDGISGFPLAASWAGIETKWISEIDPFCLKVSKKNFPNAIQYGDIKEIGGGRKWQPEPVDIICGGFPCQKYSHAGKREGNEELAGEMLRVIEYLNPRFIVAENVYGFITIDNGQSLNSFCSALQNIGYEEPAILDFKTDFTGLQTMERHIWIISKATSQRFKRGEKNTNQDNGNERKLQRANQRTNYGRDISQTRFCRVGERLSRKLDTNQRERLKALGNSIPPQVAYEIFKAIQEVDSQ